MCSNESVQWTECLLKRRPVPVGGDAGEGKGLVGSCKGEGSWILTLEAFYVSLAVGQNPRGGLRGGS